MAISARDSLKDLLQELEAFVTTKTVVGEPIHIDNTIILPLVDVSLGAGAGAKEKSAEKNNGLGAGGGVGAKMSASAILVIKDGQIRLVNIKQQDTITKVLDMVPDLIDKFKGNHKKEDQEILDAYQKAAGQSADEDKKA